MPSALTYPGVYVEEISSGVRTITGVATSIAAFVGRALRGPTDNPVTINNFGDFERIFGGLWAESSLGYAVRDFFLNGGSQAIIVRLYQAVAKADPPIPDKTALTVDHFTFEAADEGSWGSNLRFTIDTKVSSQIANSETLFNLTVREVGAGGQTIRTEQFRNLSFEANAARQLKKVLDAESKLVRWKGSWPLNPAPSLKPIRDAEKNLADALAATPLDDAKINTARANLAKLATDNISQLEQALADAKTQPDDAKTAFENAKRTSDGTLLDANSFTGPGKQAEKKGLYALEKADLFNILCIPPYLENGNVDNASLIGTAAAYCEQRRAMLLLDPLKGWDGKARAKAEVSDIGTKSKNAALFFPRLKQPDPLRDNQMDDFVPCGAVAGIFARTDSNRGVWKAPAGLDAVLVGVPQLSVPLTDAENGELNPLGINCLRAFPASGRVVWGARTLQGDDRLSSEWKYIPVRRTALFIEESLYRGTQWAVFEPNDEPLWSQLRLNIGAFMHNLFRQGAFQGSSPKDAYFVKCDGESTSQNDIDLGIVNIVVGFAPLKPAEFVVIKLQQIAGQLAV